MMANYPYCCFIKGLLVFARVAIMNDWFWPINGQPFDMFDIF